MIVLGIESTAHTFGIGIVRDGKIIANVKNTYITQSGGIIPKEAAKHHHEVKEQIYSDALNKAGIEDPKSEDLGQSKSYKKLFDEKDIDAIAFSQGPGLAPCLLEGLKFAKELAGRLKKPVVPVNHCISHLEIGKITGAKNSVMLYASGANTQIIAYSANRYRIFGETLDLGVGNFIDTFARFLGLGFPGGPAVQKLAEQGNRYIELPYVVKGMDISLSGILTNLKNKIEKMNKLPAHSHSQINEKLLNKNFLTNNSKKSQTSDSERDKYTLADLAYSMQETVFAMLIETAERALAHTGKKELLLGGGVACNTRLQEMAKIMCEERGAKLFCPTNEFLTDNGGMIAYTGEILFNNGDYIKFEDIEKLDIAPRQRTDQVEIKYK